MRFFGYQLDQNKFLPLYLHIIFKIDYKIDIFPG